MNIEKVPAKTKSVITIVEPEKFVIELSREEAEMLKQLVGNISGDPYTSKGRQFVDGIYCQLKGLGVKTGNVGVFKLGGWS